MAYTTQTNEVQRNDGLRHRHRCARCRELLPVLCGEATCREGTKWIVLCMDCALEQNVQTS